jgi:hypothetical protein
MPRSFDLSASYPGTVEEVHNAFCDEEYWQARVAAAGADTASIDAITFNDDGTVTVATTLGFRHDRLPGIVAQFHRGDLEFVRAETWTPVADGASRATIIGSIRRAPASLDGTATLTPTEGGSRMRFRATVEVKVPLVGGKIETFIGTQLAALVAAEQRFTSMWIGG